MSIEVSVILIAYNKYEQLLLTLYSLKEQNFDNSKMEVILVDDASTDETNKLQYFQAPFAYSYIHTNENVGRSMAKNIGIKQTKGEIVIFLDGEVLVDPNFIHTHYQHHIQEKNIVVAGTQSHHSVFTVLDPSFTSQQFSHFYSIAGKKILHLQKMDRRMTSTIRDKGKVKKIFIKNGRKPFCLLNENDIKNQMYKYFSFPMPCFPNEILNVHGNRLHGYHLAWMFCITRNASVSKSLIEAVGGFNEGFSGWGFEDWEFGYRLYQLGATFIEDEQIITYHQEHPYSIVERTNDFHRNYLLFTKLHPKVEVCVLLLNLNEKISLLEANHVIVQFLALEKEFPEKFKEFRESYLKLLSEIPKLRVEGRDVRHLMSIIDENTRSLILEQVQQIKEFQRFNKLVESFDILVNM